MPFIRQQRSVPIIGLLVGVLITAGAALPQIRAMAYFGAGRAGAMMACSNTYGVIAPCTASATAPAGATGLRFIFTVTNNYTSLREGGITCAQVAPVTNCVVSTTDYTLNAHASMTDTVTYAVSSTAGTGTLTVSTSGQLGVLTATVTVTATPSVAVTPDNQLVTPTSLSSTTQAFTVANNTAGSLTFTLQPTCTGNATACSSPGSITVGANASSLVSVAYTVGATLTTGTVKLMATAGTKKDSGWINDSVPKTISVTPDNQAVTTYPRASGQLFTLTSTRAVTTTFDLGFTCSGAAVTLCWAPSTVTLGGGQSTTTLVNYYAGASGTTGNVALTATAQGDTPNADGGSANVTVNSLAPCTAGSVTIWPCNVGRSAVVGDPAATDTMVLTNTSGGEMDAACYPQGHVTACSLSPDVVTNPSPHKVTLTYSVTPDTGKGSIIIDVAGLGGHVGQTIDVSVVNVVAVAPKGTAVTPAPNGTRTQVFTVTNRWSDSRRYSIVAVCSGTATGCVASRPSIGVLSAWPDTVSVTYQVGADWTTGVVGLVATDNLLPQARDSGSVSVTATPLPPSVAVTPDAVPVVIAASSSASQLFAVTNTGGYSGTFNLTALCCGAANAGCTVTPTTLALGIGASANATVSYTTGTTGTGVVQLTAKYAPDQTKQDAGSVNVTIGTKQAMGVDVAPVNPGTLIERSLCLTISAGPGAAYECADLRLAHALPTVRTLGKARTPTLLYHSQAAHPWPVVAANVTRTATTLPPDSITAALTINSTVRARGTWLAADWRPGATDRVVLTFDGWTDSTPGSPVTIFSYALSVTNWYGTSGTNVTTTTGQLAVINRRNSEFGAGWTLAGVEHLYGASPTAPTILWVDPDGSIRQYAAAQANVWKAPALDRPDSLTWNGTNYIRWLPHALQVQFDAVGRHVYTVNRLGHRSTFFYNGSTSRLDSIEPAPAGSRLRTRFYYNAVTARVDSVRSPGPNGQTRRTAFTIDSKGRTTKIKDPDGDSVVFGYNTVAADSNYITSRINALGATLTFTYDAGHRLRQSSLGLGGGQSITASYFALETRGMANQGSPSAIDTSVAYTKLDGARTDVADTTLYWLDKYGEPTRIQNALAQVTRVDRGDARWPALVTHSVAPNGRAAVAWYNARATLDSTRDSSTFDPVRAKFAVSTYTWDPKWDFVTTSTAPEGETVQFAYDPTTGNRLWQQPGTDPARRVQFKYGNSYSLLSTVWTPGIATPDSVEYDARGNVSRSISPKGFYSESFKDSLGRDTVLTSPIDLLQTIRLRQRIHYDLADQNDTTITVGPPTPYYVTSSGFSTFPLESLSVVKAYDKVGELLTVTQWSFPDTAHIGQQVRTYAYDSAGRKLTERAPAPGEVQRWGYDPAGNVTTYTSANNLNYVSTYDELNRPIRRTAPFARSWASGMFTGYSEGSFAPPDTTYFGYDVAGNTVRADNIYARIRRTFAQNGTLSTDSSWIRTMDTVASNFHVHAYGLRFRYDLEGRRTSLIQPAQLAGSGGMRPDSVAYAYDSILGTLQSVDDVVRNRFTYIYDLAGRLDSLNGPGAGGAGRLGEKFIYDADSRLVRRTEIDGATTWHVDTLSYDGRGKILQAAELPTGTRRHFGYSGLGAAVATEGQNGDYSWTDSFVYDAMGNVATNSRFGGGAHGAFTGTNGYDAGGRLIQAVQRYGGGAQNDTTSNFFDNDGSIYLSRAEHDLGNRDIGFGVMTRVFVIDSTSNLYGEDGRLRVSWLKRDSVYQNGSPAYHRYSQLEEYRYDALGRRIWTRNIRGLQCAILAPETSCVSAITRTVWDGNQILYEIRTDGDSAAANKVAWESDAWGPDTYGQFGRVGYTFGTGLDHPLSIARIGYYPGDITAITHADYRGALDGGTCVQGGAVINCPNQWPVPGLSVGYDAPPPAHYYPTPQPWLGNLVTAQQDASGYLYMRNRYYDPKSGRFTQADPIGLAGGLNVYGFASGDAVNFADPFGLWPSLNQVANIAAGFGDAVSFGLTDVVRDVIDANGAVDKSSGSYLGGTVAGTVVAAVLTDGASAEGGATVGSGAVAGKITGYTSHGLDQAISRDGVGVAPRAILDAVRNPQKLVRQAAGKLKYVGKDATVVLNKAGEVVTTWAKNVASTRL